jgi:hypothetical protein
VNLVDWTCEGHDQKLYLPFIYVTMSYLREGPLS